MICFRYSTFHWVDWRSPDGQIETWRTFHRANELARDDVGRACRQRLRPEKRHPPTPRFGRREIVHGNGWKTIRYFAQPIVVWPRGTPQKRPL